jgi:plastocyanin
MKNIAVVAGLALVLSACGDKSGTPAADTTAAVSPPPAAAAGATHNVNMVMEGTAYKFVPNDLSVKVGDQVVFTYVAPPPSGPHNVSFYPDSVPAGAVPFLMGQIKDGLDSLSTALVVEPNATITLSFAGAPVGEYRFTCTPHKAMGMHGKITVTP